MKELRNNFPVIKKYMDWFLFIAWKNTLWKIVDIDYLKKDVKFKDKENNVLSFNLNDINKNFYFMPLDIYPYNIFNTLILSQLSESELIKLLEEYLNESKTELSKEEIVDILQKNENFVFVLDEYKFKNGEYNDSYYLD